MDQSIRVNFNEVEDKIVCDCGGDTFTPVLKVLKTPNPQIGQPPAVANKTVGLKCSACGGFVDPLKAKTFKEVGVAQAKPGSPIPPSV